LVGKRGIQQGVEDSLQGLKRAAEAKEQQAETGRVGEEKL
jgi:hypothetical protein